MSTTTDPLPKPSENSPAGEGLVSSDLFADEAYQQRIYDEAMAERDAYIKRGVCDQCGAKSQWEAQGLCNATPDITGEYTCPGDDLWRDKDSEANSSYSPTAGSRSSQ